MQRATIKQKDGGALHFANAKIAALYSTAAAAAAAAEEEEEEEESK